MEHDCSIDQQWTQFLDHIWKLIQLVFKMICQNGLIDCYQSILSWKHYCKCGKVSLEPGIYCETSCCGIHTSHILAVMNVLLSELISVIPMTIVHVLPYQSVRCCSSIWINFRHVQIIQKIDQLSCARRSIVFASFFLQLFFQYLLSQFCIVVEVERNVGNHIVFTELTEFVIHHQCFTRPSKTNQHDWKFAIH